MRLLSLFVICLGLLAFDQNTSRKKAKRVPVSGTLTTTRDYCGGARPTGEIIAQLRAPKPLTKTKLYIKKGAVNSFDNKVILTLTSDENGKFHTRLRPGKYLVVDSLRKDMTHYKKLLKDHKTETKSYGPIDTLCLKEWYLTPAGTFEVTEQGTQNITINYHIPCRTVPCAQFLGPFAQ